MPVIILIGDACSFLGQIREHFQGRYSVVTPEGHYASVRSSLANMHEETLYVVPGLSKPERYEVFCLARKNRTQLVSVARCGSEGLVSSDRNPLVLKEFDGPQLAELLSKSDIAPTSANRRSKGVSLRSLGGLKAMLDRVNTLFTSENGQIECVLRECEERMVRMCSLGLSSTPEELEGCYRRMIGAELERRGILKK